MILCILVMELTNLENKKFDEFYYQGGVVINNDNSPSEYIK